MARAGHRLHCFVHRRLCVGGLVHGLCAQARLRAVRGLPDYSGSAGAGFRLKVVVETLLATSSIHERCCSAQDRDRDVASCVSAIGIRREANWILLPYSPLPEPWLLDIIVRLW